MFRSRGLTCVCRGTFATDCICHRCTVGQRAESERFCSQELFYIVLPDCSLPTNYKRKLLKSVAKAYCIRVFSQSVVETYCDHNSEKGRGSTSLLPSDFSCFQKNGCRYMRSW